MTAIIRGALLGTSIHFMRIESLSDRFLVLFFASGAIAITEVRFLHAR